MTAYLRIQSKQWLALFKLFLESAKHSVPYD